MTETDPELSEKQAVLAAVLEHVPFDGWSLQAMTAAEKDLGLPAGTARRLFMGGPKDVLKFSSRQADQRMLDALALEDLTKLRIHQRIALAVRLRLEQDAPNREAVARAVSYLALPGHHILAAKCLYATVDDMWHGIGDTSTDFNFYSKRALLAGVVSSTVLYWLQDQSEDFQETWNFLDRRIADVLKIQKARGRVERLAGRLPFVGRILAQG